MVRITKNQIRDQVAHAAAAFVGLIPAALAPSVVTFAWAGFCMGMVREVTELGRPVTWAKIKAAPMKWDAPLDLFFWTAGGAIAGLM